MTIELYIGKRCIAPIRRSRFALVASMREALSRSSLLSRKTPLTFGVNPRTALVHYVDQGECWNRGRQLMPANVERFVRDHQIGDYKCR